MKTTISFIISIILYFVVGLILWNIVCSFVDIEKKTLIELADYQTISYSVLSFIICLIVDVYFNDDNSDYSPIFNYVLLINCFVMIGINHWEQCWDSVATVFVSIYNIVNVVTMTLSIRNFFS